MGLDNESDRTTGQPHADVKREAAETSEPPKPTDEGERSAESARTPQDSERVAARTPTAQIRIRDLQQTLDLLKGLQRIMSSFHAEQRGKHAPDPLLDELEGIHGHGYNWEALRYQGGVGQGWSYIAASIEELRTRLDEALANAAD